MLLVTDLDGTFLSGTRSDRRKVYNHCKDSDDVTLVYATGRGLEVVRPVLNDPFIASPDYIICDVGATVVEGQSLQPIQPLQSDIEADWAGENSLAESLAAAYPELERQSVPQRRRCSFYCDSTFYNANRETLEEIAERHNCEVLYSSNRYLDFLPKGTSKGSTVAKLIDFLGADKKEVLIAGDTLNDLSMINSGFYSVCVGRSEKALLDQTQHNPTVLHASRSGCGGILEGMKHFGFQRTPQRPLPTPAAAAGKAELVMVYHRLPYEEFIEDGAVVRRPHRSPNGILPTLLGFFANESVSGSWVAWALRENEEDLFEAKTTVHKKHYPNLTCSRVPLTAEQVTIFYKKFSKEAFWPMLHSFWERAKFKEEHWEVYVQTNKAFAEHTANEAAEGAIVWIHDYNLWLVPGFLRALRPDLTIAFFHHTYFPSSDIFNVVPWRSEIISSLVQCNYIGFHIPRQVENFIDVLGGVLPFEVLERQDSAPRFRTYGCAVGVPSYTTKIKVFDREISLGAHPVGLDLNRLDRCLEEREHNEEFASLLQPGVRRILAVERLDYTKGILQKLQAYERLLHEHPELVGKITLINICVPAAKEMEVYQKLQRKIDETVGRINGTFSRIGYRPVQLFSRHVPFNELVSYYAIADIMWTTPLRDGLNLVAKEYVASRHKLDKPGVLVLSEFAGVAAELHGALLTNPHDQSNLVSVMTQAIAMSDEESRDRLNTMYDVIEYNDVESWGEEFMDAVREA